MCTETPNENREPKKMSLLKPYTNFEKIKAMSIDELAVFYPCPYDFDYETEGLCKKPDCIACTKQWLESEAE